MTNDPRPRDGRRYRAFRFPLIALLLCLVAAPTRAAYDIDALGVPRFVNTNYIDITKITRISKFRGAVGHDYSDGTQFQSEAVKDAQGRVESCRSMKHYFLVPDSTVRVFSPVAGRITGRREDSFGTQLEITPDAQPDFHFAIFHIDLAAPVTIGEPVAEGQQLGTHIGLDTWSDIAVWVQTPRGKHLISYFETLTDPAFETFGARGMNARDDAIRTKAESDAEGCGFFVAPSSDFVVLSGATPASQTISVETTLSPAMNVGAAPVEVRATASSGLPVVLVSTTPKICTATNNAVTPRRPGICKLRVTQAGNDVTYEAYPVRLQTTVLRAGASPTPPQLGILLPPAADGPQSYLRFFNAGEVAGTVTASLIDRLSGEAVLKWQSPPIAPGASPQFHVTALESAAPAGYARPLAFGLRIETETTVDGYMQHVIFDPATEAVTNASTCSTGVTAPRHRLMNVHTSRLGDYASTIVLNNVGATSAQMALALRDSISGEVLGRFYSGGLTNSSSAPTFAYPHQQIVFPEATAETAVYLTATPTVRTNIAPPYAYHFNLTDDNAASFASTGGCCISYYYQHYITNRRSGVLSDMTTVCALDGRSDATVNAKLQAAGLFSTLQQSAQSLLRFYNSGTSPGSVTVKIFGAQSDQQLGSWVSPEIPAGGMREYGIAQIERELTLYNTHQYIRLALEKENTYALTVETGIDGTFQHLVRNETADTLSNLSTCFESVTAEPRTLIGVNSGAVAGHVSIVVITNTGSSVAAANLDVYDARTGALLGTYYTPPTAAGGYLAFEVGAMEAAMKIPFDAERPHYIIKAQESFEGFLQHLVRNTTHGVLNDMTTACMM